MSIKAVFFDIGDVLFAEDAPHATYLHCVLQGMRRSGVDIAWDAFAAEFRQQMRRSPATAVRDTVGVFVANPDEAHRIYHIGHDVYQATRRPRAYGMLQDDITAVVEALRGTYKTGIIANQHPVIMEALSDYGLFPLFDTIVIDEIEGVSKPDPAIFRLALDRIGCRADEAIMIGDRADVDIGPAKRLGMATIRLRVGSFYVHYDPLTDDERADIEVRAVGHILAAVESLSGSRTRHLS